MKRIFTLTLILLSISLSYSQNNDCVTALVVCNDPPPAANPMGIGINDFADSDNQLGCMSAEVSSVWFYFQLNDQCPPNALLGFILNPLGGLGQDYDWALYGPDVNCNNLGAPIRCSSSSAACGFCPQTGIGMGATDLSEGPGSGDGFVKLLNVQAGQGYFLFIENWTQTGIGFNMQFTNEAADYIDCAATPPCSIAAIASSDITICAGDNPFQLNVTSAGGSPPIMFNWDGTSGGTSFLDDPDSQNPNVTVPESFTGTIIYTVTASDGICDNSDEVKVVVNPLPVIAINPIGILCSNSPPLQMIGTPQNGKWGGVANSTGVVDPFTLTTGQYEVTLEYTNQFGCKNMSSLDIQVVVPTDIFIDPLDPVCINTPPFILQVTPSGGTWKGSIDNNGKFDPSKYGVGLFNAVYSYTSAEGCKSADSVLIEVVALPKIIISDPGPLCTSELIHNLDVDPQGGIWSGVADPSGSVYPLKLGVGSFKVKYEYTSKEGCAGKDSLTIKVIDGPHATIKPSIDICNSANTGMPTSIDFNTLILSGDKSGSWTDNNNSGGTGSLPNLDFKNVPQGNYIFIYHITTSGGICPEFLDTIIVNVKDCDCPSVALVSPVVSCNSNQSIDLNNYKITTEAGNWTINSTPVGTNPAILNSNILDINNKDAGIYIIEFTLSNTPAPACPASATFNLILNQKPYATLSASAKVCNQGSGPFPLSIDLKSLIISGDNKGVWLDLENSGATGTNNLLDFTGVVPGSYTFSYITSSATAPCQESTYTIDIVVEDCKCPSLFLDPAPTLCNNNGNINLNNLASIASPGTWSLKAIPPGTNPAKLNGSLFTSNNSDAGDYILSYTLNTNPPTGCKTSADITITVIEAPFATLQSTIKVCNALNATPNSTILDLSTLITAGDNTGKWLDKNSSGATGTFPTFDFTGVTPGNYIFEYTTGNAVAPCTNVTYSMAVIVKDCNCPDLSIVPVQVLCNDLIDFDLSSLELTNEAGVWSIISTPGGTNPAIINGKTFTILNADAGNYTLQFKALNTPPVGCPNSSDCLITINKKPFSGIALPKANYCESDIVALNLVNLIINADPLGNWSVSLVSANPGIAFDPILATVQIDKLFPGNYEFDYTITGVPPCSNAITTVKVQVAPIFSFKAGQDVIIDCTNSSTTLGQSISLPPGFKMTWTGPGIIDPNIAIPTVKDPGVYVASISNIAFGCISKDSLSVIVSGVPITGIDINKQDEACPGQNNGKIEITNVTGGTPAYEYSWNGNISMLPYIENLNPGNYLIKLTDQLGCIFDTSIVIIEGKTLSIDLGPDLILDQGSPFSISAIVNVAPNQIDSIIWYPSVCLNCFQLDLIAEYDISYKVTAYSKNGCKAEDKIDIQVVPLRRVFIPNVFSPNGDGINDIFFISTGDEVKEISSLQIYNRWGSPVYSSEHFQPNDPHFGWNGVVNGKPENSGVFVYWSVIEFKDGSLLTYKGDVTIQR